MSEKAELHLGIATLRMKMATNHFKRLLLGDLHVPGKAQKSTTTEALGGKSEAISIFDRTWDSWFAEPSKIPRKTTVRTLDNLAASKIRVCSQGGLKGTSPPQNTFSHMIHGGLVSSMQARSKSKQPLNALMARVHEYRPDSALHLHLDAVEMCALSDGYGDIPWETVKRIGAKRILELLMEKWGPRQGSIYPHFSSRLRLAWEAASPNMRSEMRKAYASFKPNLFESALTAVPRPDWARTGIDLDVAAPHVYKLLFALAADTDFLKADRLASWSLDLATAALAMHALAWSDRYTTFDIPITDELIYWIAFDEILFSSTQLDSANGELVGAMMRLDADWSDGSFRIFMEAREKYHSELAELGLYPNELLSVAMQATKIHPLKYVA